ncbi:MAG: hypothetical protein GX359_06265 [Clostridiales bacterium]|nr:hypothetical protein [Clostridiales bacterium]
MTNLLEETLEILRDNGKSFDDVVWIGSPDGYIAKELFLKLADVCYNNSFGGQEIAEDLLIVGEDWWMERCEYDGSEWWEFKTMPVKPKDELHPTRLNNGLWDKLVAFVG